jgi:hypothetical protein
MKAAEEKPTSDPAGKAAPFFSKTGAPSFFAGNNTGSAFFSGTAKPPAVQPKLTIGPPHDKYELEADAMADKVVQRSADTASIQTQCAACEQKENLQKKEKEDDELLNPKLQRKCAECEKVEKLQTKANSATSAASPDIESSLTSGKSTGTPLPAETRQQMEASFGADFSTVRIHTDSQSTQMNRDLQAHAFTHGRDIYFNAGKYNAGNKEGRHLLAHELTHVVQQGATKQIRRDDTGTDKNEPASDPIYEDLRGHFRNADLEQAKTLVVNLNPDQKDFILASNEFMNLATRSATGGADFGDDSITQLMEAFLSGGYQNLVGCLTWMFYEFDADENNNENFLKIIGHHTSEEQKAAVRVRFKSNFIEHLGDRGMTDVLKLLGGPLDKKLKWLKDEDVDSWEMAREVIIDHLSKKGITKEESNNIYIDSGDNDDMRWYFGRKIDVGDNEMVRLVTLLGFELYQKLDWMIYEDTNASLVHHVLVTSTLAEVNAVLGNQTLLNSLEKSVGKEAYSNILFSMKRIAGTAEGSPETISVLESTIKEELKVDTARNNAGTELVKLGSFLLEAAMDELQILIPNPNVPQENKLGWGAEMQYCAELLKMYFKYPEEELENTGYALPEIASNQVPSGTVQASFIQAMPTMPPLPPASTSPMMGPTIGNAIRSLTRLPVPRLPSPVRWVKPPPIFTRPTPQPWYSKIVPLPPLYPHAEPKPGNENVAWNRYDWQTETGKRLDLLRRQIEEMKTWRHVAPTPETQPGEEQDQEEKKKKKKIYQWQTPFEYQGRDGQVNYIGPTIPGVVYIPNGHHVWPEVLGGDPDQTLMTIITTIHNEEMHYGRSPVGSPVITLYGSIYTYVASYLNNSQTFGPNGSNVLQGRRLTHTGGTGSANQLLITAMSAGTGQAARLAGAVRQAMTQYYGFFRALSDPEIPFRAYRDGLDDTYDYLV